MARTRNAQKRRALRATKTYQGGKNTPPPRRGVRKQLRIKTEQAAHEAELLAQHQAAEKAAHEAELLAQHQAAEKAREAEVLAQNEVARAAQHVAEHNEAEKIRIAHLEHQAAVRRHYDEIDRPKVHNYIKSLMGETTPKSHYSAKQHAKTPFLKKIHNHFRTTACKYLPIKEREWCKEHQRALEKKWTDHKKSDNVVLGGKRTRRQK